MKKFQKLIALLLAAALMIAALAACSGKKEPEPTPAPTEAPTEAPAAVPTDAPTEIPSNEDDADIAKLVGSWKASLNLGEQIRKSIESTDEYGMFAGIEIEDAFFELAVTYNADGTYKASLDKEGFKEACSKISKALVEPLKQIMIAFATMDVGEDGETLSEEELLEQLGIKSWDELGDKMLEQMVEGIENADSESSGKFELDGNKLYMSHDENSSIDKSEYVTVSISGDKLSFESAKGAALIGIDQSMFPIVFTRVG